MMKLFKTRARRERELREWFVKTPGSWEITAIPYLIDYILDDDKAALERADAINKREQRERGIY